MLRAIDFVMIGLVVGAAAFTFKVKADSETAIARVSELERQIRAERELIDVLRADWSLLTDPARLAVLVERYRAELQLEPLDPAAIAELSEVPLRRDLLPGGEEATRRADIRELIDDAEIVTGSVPAPQLPVEGTQR